MDIQVTGEKLLATVHQLLERIDHIEHQLESMSVNLPIIPVDRKYYSTAELAEMMNVSKYTVQERWCNQGRIECSKQPQTKRWRIPANEVRRLLREGPPL